MKWYNFETMFISVCDALRKYLYDNNIYYELSQAYATKHFEIKASATQAQRINEFLENLPGNIWNE